MARSARSRLTLTSPCPALRFFRHKRIYPRLFRDAPSLVQLAGCSGPNYFGSQSRPRISPVRAYSVHVPARRPRTLLHSEHDFAKINVCRNGIAQAERSGGYRLASPQRLFLLITGSTVTTEPKSLFAGKRAAMSPFTCARVTRSNWDPLATTARKPAS
jgi:hypothetical protein